MLEVNSLIRSGLLMLLATPVAAHSQSTAQDGFSIVGRPFYDSSGHVALSVVTQNINKDSPDKFAGIIMEFELSDEHYQYNGKYDKQIVAFASEADWQEFLSMWRKARALPKENYFKSGDDYFDGSNMLEVSKDHDGDMSFTMAGNPDSSNIPQNLHIFDLSSKDVVAFDGVVKRVSLYFHK